MINLCYKPHTCHRKDGGGGVIVEIRSEFFRAGAAVSRLNATPTQTPWRRAWMWVKGGRTFIRYAGTRYISTLGHNVHILKDAKELLAVAIQRFVFTWKV